MSINTTIISDTSILTQEELLQEYERLATFYKALKSTQESELQKIFELQKLNKVANQNLAHLENEATELTSQHAAELAKVVCQLEATKSSNHDLHHQNISLETNCDQLTQRIAQMEEKIKYIESESHGQPECEAISKSLEGRETREAELELEKEQLNEQIFDLRHQLYSYKRTELNLTSQLESLTDKVQCLEENLRSKKDDLAEKNLLLDTANEKIAELNAKMAAVQLTPENAKKGNSLFAEVDDQRQKMRSILATQNQQYQHMKKSFDEKEFEIRRLKLENDAIEQQVLECRFLFANADKSYKRHLNERINQLVQENEQLMRRKEWTEERLMEVANGQGVTWIDSMMKYCKKETEDIKGKLYNCMLQKSLLEDNLYSIQQELVKWRLEALKSRVTIMKREALLNRNDITFASVDYTPPTDKEAKNAKPQWLVDEIIKQNNAKDEKVAVAKSTEDLEEETEIFKQSILVKLQTIEPAPQQSKLTKTLPKTPKNVIVIPDSDSELDISEIQSLDEDQSSYHKEIPMFDMSLDESVTTSIRQPNSPKISPPLPPSSTPLSSNTPVYRDIIYKPKKMPVTASFQPRKILVEDNCASILVKNKASASTEKKVHFLEKSDGLCDVSLNFVDKQNIENAENNEVIFKKPNKSNVIVRKIIIPSKPIARLPENK